MRLHSKNARITGGSRGIGLATARLFIAKGAIAAPAAAPAWRG